MKSAVVKKIPFITDIMHMEGSLHRVSQWQSEKHKHADLGVRHGGHCLTCIVIDCHQDMLGQLAFYEDKLFGFSGTSRSLSNMRDILEISATPIKDAQDLHSRFPSQWSPHEATQVVALFCAYKLVDVYAFVNGIAPSYDGPPRRPVFIHSHTTLSSASS